MGAKLAAPLALELPEEKLFEERGPALLLPADDMFSIWQN
jgi:hypothetical protein